MFVGVVVVIMIICISILSIINSYFLVFSKNYIDLSDYYQSEYAAISCKNNSDTQTFTWLWINDRIWTWECGTDIFTWMMWEYTNSLQK